MRVLGLVQMGGVCAGPSSNYHRVAGCVTLCGLALTSPRMLARQPTVRGLPSRDPIRARFTLSREPGSASLAPYYAYGCGVVCGETQLLPIALNDVG